ncbi:MAG: hypothetical protein SO003_05225, partial [Candidatus Borkfalkiaceae bacterium]|nr:hypothetical protein [Christensenellaceae bacterium]
CFLSPIGTSCHFAYAADAPLVSLSRHFPRFSGGIYPKEEAKLHVILSMPSEQTCLQGFASDDIHKALAFLIKNAGNDSFNAPALSAE